MKPRGWRRWLLALYPRNLRQDHPAEIEELLARPRPRSASGRIGRAVSDIRFVVKDAVAARRLLRQKSAPYGGHPPKSGRRGPLDALLVDGRYALRRLKQTPLFTAVAALSLGLGIGANSAAFGVITSVLFRPFPAQNADELVDVYMRDS